MARSRIIEGVPALGMPICHQDCSNRDDDYIEELIQGFEILHWPPIFSDAKLSLSEAISTIRGLGTIGRGARNCVHTGGLQELSATDFHSFADDVERMCEGLCLDCAKAGTVNLKSKCGH